ncbi:MAG: pyrroline-5-carboxylate reductase [Pseudomonadota bacterium]
MTNESAQAFELPGDGPVLLVGCGKMGGAMLAGWLAQGLPAQRVVVQDPGPLPDIADMLSEAGIPVTEAYDGPPPSVALLAVKPQVMDTVYPTVAKTFDPTTLVISVAAGRTIAGFEADAPEGAAIIRSIPNTPSAIGQGMTVCFANDHTTDAQHALATRLLAAIGRVGWVDAEHLIDAATAVSGSGPAYVFFLAETLAAAGVEVGLPERLARELAAVTIAGAGDLMLESSDQPDQLRRNVTSPNGTTEAALNVLMADDGLRPLMSRAVKAAEARSRDLAR